MSYINPSRVQVLDRPECLALLRRHQYGVGRVGLGGTDPVILPVNYLLDHGDVVVQTGDGPIHDAAMAEDRVAFELDGIPDPSTKPQAREDGAGWSVLARGRAQVVTAPSEQTYLQLGHLVPAAGGFRPHFVRIVIDDLTGRRLSRATDPQPPHP